MLQIKHIRKQYVTGDLVQTALDDISLNFRDNEFVAILGPSGSGKTTLLNIIGGLDRYDSGDLIINGISTKQYKDKDWDSYRNHTIGFVFQSYNLIPHQTVLANVELALTISGISKSERRRRAREALERVGLGEQIHKKPNQMSGGQMQRVAIARALVNNPAILLADEPTGALDSDTSVQVMDMLAEVAKDRLVIMVTHNPELAEQYANRIVRVKDGHVLEDTNPLKSTAAEQPARHENMGHSSMSPLTALGLSFNNLRTKKGRTLLTSFAGSIGIIGIALILALSTGINAYIDDLQRDTMTAYPISIEAQSIDMTSLIEMSQKQQKHELEPPDHQLDAVYADGSTFEVASTVTTSFKQNNLTEFKKYIEDPDSKIHKYIGENGVVYTYDTRFGIYTYDSEDALVNTDGSTLRTDNKYSFMNMMMRSMTMMTGTSSNFQELMPGTDGALISRTVTDNYEVIYGTMPDSYDDLVLVLDANNEIEATFLYQLGFLPTSEYKEIAKRIEDGDEVQEEQRRLDYAAICAQEFSLVPECDRYVKGDDGIYTLIDENSPEFDQLLQDAVKLHITAVIRPKEELDTMFITQPVGYTSALTDYLIDYTSRSEIVRAQEDDPDVNILNGLHFDADGSTDKLADVKNYIDGMGVSEKATLYQTILMLEQMREMGSDAQPETEATSETKSFEEALGSFSPLSEKPQTSTRRSAAPRGAMAAHLGNFLGAGLHRLEVEIRTGITAQDPAPAGIAIADFRLMRAPDKTIYQLGEPLDLTGGIIHDSFVALNENGEPELIDNLQPLDFAEYTLQVDAFDSTRPGIYPITVVKDYTDTNGEPAQESVVFYTMVIDPAMVAGTTDPTEPVTEPTELPTDETATAESTDPTETTTETSPRFVFPTLPTDLTFPTLPTDLTLPTMPNVDFSDFFSDVLADALDKYMKKQTDNGTAFSGFSGMSPTDMAALYSQMMGGSGVSLPSGSANDLASLYAQMMGGSGASLPAGTSQNDLAALYAQMMGGSGAALPAGTSPNDMAALYAQMMGGGTGTTGTTMPSDMAALAAQMAGQTGLTQEQMADMYTKMYGNITPEDIEKMMAVAEMSEPELAEALDEYMKDPDEDILLEVYDRYIAAGSYDSNMTTFGVVSREAPSAINIYVDSFAAKEGISSCIKEYNETATEEDQISYTDYIGLLMSSVTTIVNAISYILIAFVAVSLIVSSIMIGIITYISVLERTKEIGILRAIGASKHNISQVFNAETFIIGLCSGLIGVGLSWLTLIPGNLLIHSLAKTDSINAILPIPAALILIAISIFLTLVGGFIPAKKASTKDPVTALRTE